MSATVLVLIVLLIGIVVGVGVLQINRPTWFTRKLAGGRRAEVTSALVGIAGAFIGFHVAALFELAPIVLLIAALLGATGIVWVWREARF